MKLLQKIVFFFLLFLGNIFLYAQTPGINYQAIILNNTTIEIPGTDVSENQVPLGLEEITFRFSISNELEIEYIEEQTVFTDKNGMISLIVGDGNPINATFSDIIWDGQLKYLNVEMNILGNNEGFVFLDTQKILYVPHPSGSTTSQVHIVNSLDTLTPPYQNGDLAWIENYGENNIPLLIIYNGSDWVPTSADFDPTNELDLIAVEDASIRDTQFNPPAIGNQVWNQACKCIQIYDGTNWISIASTNEVSNGLYKEGTNIKLGGNLEEPTSINTSADNTLSINNLQQSTSVNDEVMVLEQNTGVLKKTAITSLINQKQAVFTAVDGQLQFETPDPISNIDKLDVYRNGARINFTVINATTIELEPEAICYQGDEIRIVQIK